jgi:signal transduction histidine kinase
MYNIRTGKMNCEGCALMNDSERLVFHTIVICVIAIIAFASAASALYFRRELAKLKKEEDAAEARALLEQENASLALSEATEKILRYHSLISHGFRVPISVIMGYADILMGKMVADGAARDEYLRKMCERASYMNELLTYSLLEMRCDTGTFSPTHKQFEVLSVLRGVIDAMSDMARAAGVEIRFVSEPSEIFMRGNAIGLSKVFYNIVENALKYAGEPGTLNVTAALLAEEEALIVFKDDGPGVPSEDAPHIFERNYKGANARGGDGLGLWIAKTEIESHGGSIEAKSDEGKGMGVYITLPATCAPEQGPDFEQFQKNVIF